MVTCNRTASFILTTSHKWTPKDDSGSYNIGTVVYKGEGIVVDKIASDIADFHYTCEAHGDAHCVEEFQDIEFDGQVPFTLTFLP